jgi:hypothetical protein
MTSVTRFSSQIPVANTYYDVQQVLNSIANGQALTNLVFEFVPSSSNYVGNYPSGFNNTSGGFVIPATAALVQAIQQAQTAASGTIDATTGTPGSLELRDMGKTIFAPIGTVTSSTPNAPGTSPAGAPFWGYYRQVQLINPAVITQGPGFMGGTTGNTFGVLGAANTPDLYTDNLVFYIPISVGGVSGGNSNGVALNARAFLIAGGQM